MSQWPALRPPPPERLLGPMGKLLRPVVRLLIQSGVTFPMLADLLRTLYVEIATKDVLQDPKARTDSRISLLTGIHRKEIRRQRVPEAEATPAAVTLNGTLMSQWLGAPIYQDPDGRPALLPRTGPVPSFESLVAGVTRDVRPRTVLDDWLAQGIVTVDPAGHVRLEATAFLPRADLDSQLFYFARNLHDHIAAAAANVVAAEGARFLDRSVHYDGLGIDAAAALEAAARTEATQMLVALNQAALGIAAADDAAAASAGLRPTRRVNMGVYLYVEDETTVDIPGVS